MCGIAGFHVKDPSVIKKHEGVELLVDELLKSIEHRGKHATGFVSVGFDGKVTLDKSAVTASDFIKDRSRVPEGVRTVLLHTRYWTKGDPKFLENNHPVVVDSCFAVHNGHINNDDEIFTELGTHRPAEVDSIAIPASANFEGIGEIADIKTALERLEGGFATAIIDPVKHPGRLILAKGTSSPLYIVDTPKFIVWASTQAAIKDAWGKVLGTPPNDKKIESITEGNFLVVDDTTVTREKFTVKRRPFVGQFGGNRESTRTNSGSVLGRNGHPVGFQNAPRTPVPEVVQAREVIAEIIKTGGTARTFEDHQNGLYDDDDFKDVVGERKWFPCTGCNRLVLEPDMVKSEWGTICCDCYTGTKKKIATETQEWEDEDVCAGTSVPRIDRGDRDALEVWADHELHLHREVIEEMSKEVGSFYSTQAIEFLCFFTTPEYREVAGKAVNNLITELRDLYELTYMDIAAEAFEGSCAVPLPDQCAEEGCINLRVSNSFRCETHRPKAEVLGSEDETPNPLQLRAGTQEWGFCHSHNRAYVRNGGCPQCVAEYGAELDGQARLAAMLDGGLEDDEKDEEGEGTSTPSTEIGVYLPFERGRDTVIAGAARQYTRSSGGTEEGKGGDAADDEGGEVIELPRCGRCGTFVLRATEESCAVCKFTEAHDAANEGAGCTACSSAAPEFVVGYAGRNYYYCKACYGTCGKLIHNTNDKTVELCHAKTNHMLKDGVRVCHQHVRGQSNAISDTTLRKRGATITEVTS